MKNWKKPYIEEGTNSDRQDIQYVSSEYQNL